MPIQTREDAAQVARLIRDGKITGEGRERALQALRDFKASQSAEAPAQLTPEDRALHEGRLKQAEADLAQVRQPVPETVKESLVRGAAEAPAALTSLATGAAGGVAGGAAGVAGTLTNNLAGLAGMDRVVEPSAWRQGASEAVTNALNSFFGHPEQTQLAQAVNNTLGAPFRWLGEQKDKLVGAVGGPQSTPGRAIGETAGLAGDLLNVAGLGAARTGLRRAAAQAELTKPAPLAGHSIETQRAAGIAPAAEGPVSPTPVGPAPSAPPPIQELRKAGFVVRPSDVRGEQPGVRTPGLIREQLVGSQALADAARQKNAALAVRLAGEDAGIPAAPWITEEALSAAEAPHAATFRQAAQEAGQWSASPDLGRDLDRITATGTMDPADRTGVARFVDQYRQPTITGTNLVGEVRALREYAKKFWDSSNSVSAHQAVAARQIAEALENELEARLMQVNGGVRVADVRAARTQLAKINDVRNSLKGATPDLSYFARLADKGVPLTGNLATLALAGEEIPGVTQHAFKNLTPGSAASAAEAAVQNPTTLGLLRQALTAGLRNRLLDEPFQSKFGAGPAAPSVAEQAIADWSGEVPAAAAAPAAAAPATIAQDLLQLPYNGPILRPQGWTGATPLADEAGVVGSAQAREAMGLTPDVVRAAQNHPALASEQPNAQFVRDSAGGLTLAEDVGVAPRRELTPAQKGLTLTDEPLPSTAAAPDLSAFNTDGLFLAQDLLQLPYNGPTLRPQGWSGGTPLVDEAGAVGTARARETMGLTPDVRAAGAQHPAAVKTEAKAAPKTPKASKTPTATRTFDKAKGEYVFETENGAMIAVETPTSLRVRYQRTKDGAKGKGEGTARLKAGIDYALANGKVWESDKILSPEAARMYDRLEAEGYTVERNPVNKDKAGVSSKNGNKPAFRVTAAPRS